MNWVTRQQGYTTAVDSDFGVRRRTSRLLPETYCGASWLGDEMNDWEKEFTKKMESLKEQSSGCLERFLQEDLQGAFDALSGFLAQWKFQSSNPQTQPGRRSFKFGLTEDAYVLVTFHLEGVDTLECDTEYGLPGVGRVAGSPGRLRVSGKSIATGGRPASRKPWTASWAN